MSKLKNLLLLSLCISCALLYSFFETFLLTLMLKKIWLIFICTEVHRPLNTHLTSWSFGGFPRVFFIWLLGSFESRICRQSCFKLLLFVIFNYVKNSVLTQSRFLFCWWELVIITKLLFFDISIIYGLRSYFFFSFLMVQDLAVDATCWYFSQYLTQFAACYNVLIRRALHWNVLLKNLV